MITDNREESTRTAAEDYMREGLAVIPVPAGSKNPNRPGWEKERHTLEDVPKLWSNGQGVGILWGEPSDGRVDVDCDWPEARVAAAVIAPPTKTFGRGGAPWSHLSYKPIGGTPKTKRYKVGGSGGGDDRSVVELLSTGTQSLAPPSVHESGEVRTFYDDRPATEIDTAELLEIVADIATAALLARNWPGEGARKDYCFAAAGYIGRRLPRERVLRVMEAAIEASGDEEADSRFRDVRDTLENLEGGKDVTGGPTLDGLASTEITKILSRWHGWRPSGATKTEPTRGEGKPTDDELRDRFIERCPDYSYGLGRWRHYGAGIWDATEELGVRDEVCRVLEDAKDEKVRPNRALVLSVSELAKARVAIADERWDADPDVLVCANGALRLSTRELEPHSREHYATARVPYDYDPDATSEVWEQRVMGELIAPRLGVETARFIQEFAGYALTTDTSHEIALWFTGKHGGGRSTILAGLGAMLGPRAGVLSLSDLDRTSFALTNLPGKTLVTATEQPSTFMRGGGVLNAIISGEPIQIDLKFRDPIEVTPRCKIAWAMNELPRVGSPDDGIFRRVRVLSIPEIPEKDRDPQVKEDVKASGAGILNWALDGLERLLERGRFTTPEKVRVATDEFKEDNDVVALFVEEKCDVGPEFWESSSCLYDEYRAWALDHGHKPHSSTSIAREWKRLGFEKKRQMDGVRWLGLKVSARAHSDFPPDIDIDM
jgi:P4 family phage/plasmid primase-like protien